MESSSSDDDVLSSFKKRKNSSRGRISRRKSLEYCDESDESNTGQSSDEGEITKNKTGIRSTTNQAEIVEKKDSSSESENEEDDDIKRYTKRKRSSDSNREESSNGDSSDEYNSTENKIKICSTTNQTDKLEEKDSVSQSETEEDDDREHPTKLKRPSDSDDNQSQSGRESANSDDLDPESTKEEEETKEKTIEKTIEKSKKGKNTYKQKSTDSTKLVRLRKYLKVAGIRVQNYTKLFEGCKSKKAKELKLLELLESKGLKGKPTLEKCKKLYKKIERQREVAELDMDNIIDTTGNKAARVRTTRNRIKSIEVEPKKDIAAQKKEDNIFGNLRGIIDSEESENEYSKQETVQKKKRLKMISSDEDS